jgi:NAD(P)-dependent dehydrogenase (short-subunit alcohol dehydrogenase family)
VEGIDQVSSGTQFQGKVAVVTGAGGGIGLASAVELSRQGADVIGVDRDAKLEASFSAECPNGKFAVLDVTDAEQIGELVRTVVADAGQLDVLVNAAGIRDIGSVLDTTPEDWRRVIDVDLGGLFYCSQAAGRVMVERGSGSIVNIASIAGFVAFANRPAYTAAKHGAIGLTKVMAAELGPRGVRVNAVCPGLTRTPLTVDYVDEPHVVESLRSVIPQGRSCDAGEIAAAVAFLASDAASYINGTALPVDGGFIAAQTFDSSGDSPTFVKPFSVTGAGL